MPMAAHLHGRHKIDHSNGDDRIDLSLDSMLWRNAALTPTAKFGCTSQADRRLGRCYLETKMSARSIGDTTFRGGRARPVAAVRK